VRMCLTDFSEWLHTFLEHLCIQKDVTLLVLWFFWHFRVF
jgi:hypothetical protein